MVVEEVEVVKVEVMAAAEPEVARDQTMRLVQVVKVAVAVVGHQDIRNR